MRTPRQSRGKDLSRVSPGPENPRAVQPRQNQTKPASNRKTIIPPPQSSRIVGRYFAGQSIRKIAREENRDRETVTRIVRSKEVKDCVRKMRERYFSLAPQALDAVQHDLQHSKDGRLGREILKDIGVILSPEERNVVAMQAEPLDKSTLTSSQKVLLAIGKAMDEKTRLFGLESPTYRFELYQEIKEQVDLLRKRSIDELQSTDEALWSGLRKALLKEKATIEAKTANKDSRNQSCERE